MWVGDFSLWVCPCVRWLQICFPEADGACEQRGRATVNVDGQPVHARETVGGLFPFMNWFSIYIQQISQRRFQKWPKTPPFSRRYRSINELWMNEYCVFSLELIDAVFHLMHSLGNDIIEHCIHSTSTSVFPTVAVCLASNQCLFAIIHSNSALIAISKIIYRGPHAWSSALVQAVNQCSKWHDSIRRDSNSC